MCPYSDPGSQGTANVHNISQRVAEDTRNDLHTLRMSVTLAWQERSVMLTCEEPGGAAGWNQGSLLVSAEPYRQSQVVSLSPA